MNNELLTNNYIPLENFIGKDELAYLVKQFCEKEKDLTKDDTDVKNAPFIYNFQPFVELLHKKTDTISAILNEEVVPTYCYARIYKNGSQLLRHKDREACEVSVTLNLSQDMEWPIYMTRPDNSSFGFILEPGDGILYLGCKAWHWRDKYEGQNYKQVFLHYVRKNGPNFWAAEYEKGCKSQ